MDEDENQEELINQNASHSKGRTAALWSISDDSDDDDDDDGEESEEEESDSSEEEDECHQGEEEAGDGDEVNEEMDDEEEDENSKEDEAVGGTSADMALMSSDDDADACPICLNSFSSQPVATPENCVHYFCLDCILEWAKNANSCPVDRIPFNSIYLRKCYGGKVKKMITVQKPAKEGAEEVVDVELEQTNCEVCGGSDREDRLLLCDGCDAGYHMECLTPPMDSVPVEEWFCPECEANSRRTRDSSDEVSETESLPSTARPATSHHQHRTAGPTRAIARTQQSERVRASVNRHRITQARSSQLAPTYLTQSTWLDETINAVVAGLNTSVYIRDLTPRVPPSRKRKTGKSRKVKRRRTSSTKGQSATNGFKRRKYKRRKTKSRKKLALKKVSTSRSRIANSLGIVKNKRNPLVPTVYRPSEYTLSSMRADIGAASFSIYGDPSDLDPFVDCENEEQQAHVSSALEAKRRGISHSALRSHQPVARPVVASLSSRRALDVPRSLGVVEAAPVPDLLGSILSGQNMLLMDSSDVVINRDGSLKTSKTIMPSPVNPSSSSSSSSSSSNTGETNSSPGTLPTLTDHPPSLHNNGPLPGSCPGSSNRPLSQRSADLPPCPPSSAHPQTSHSHDLPTRGHPGANRPAFAHRGSSDIRASRETSIHPKPSSNTKGSSQSQSQPKKAPTKPMWVDVSELPRIPKIKRERGVETNYDSSQDGSLEGSFMPETGINGLAGDKSKQQSVDQQKQRVEGEAQRSQPNGAASSSTFSNSFAASSSTAGFPTGQSRHASSSSAISFRINSSGNSWQSRQKGMASSSDTGRSRKEHWREKEEEAKKRQLHRAKQMLLASHVPAKKDQDSNDIYDPSNPTLSDSSCSDGEAESCRLAAISSSGKTCDLVQNKPDLGRVKMETGETEVSRPEARRANTLKTMWQEGRCSLNRLKVEQPSRVIDIKVEKQISTLGSVVKREQSPDDADEAERCGSVKVLKPEPDSISIAAHHSLHVVKREKETEESVQKERSQHIPHPHCKRDPSDTTSAPTNKKQAVESKPGSASCSKSPSREHLQKTVSKHVKKEQGSVLEVDKGRRGDQGVSGMKEKEKTSSGSTSREKRRARSPSQSSQSDSPEHRSRKRRRDGSKDRRRHRSVSSSSSSEDSRRKKHKARSSESNEDRERDKKRGRLPKEKNRGRSGSRSPSRSKEDKRGSCGSRSRSRSREGRKDQARQQQPSQSRRDKAPPPSRDKRLSRDDLVSPSEDKRRQGSTSSSLERWKEAGSSSQSSNPTSVSSASSSKSTKQIQDKNTEKDVVQNSLKEEKTAKGDKEDFLSFKSTTSVKMESKDVGADLKDPTAGTKQNVFVFKEIKKEEEPSLDMFDDSPVAPSLQKIKAEPCSWQETDIKVEMKEDFSRSLLCDIKSESCEFTIKSEPTSPEINSFPPFTAPGAADDRQRAACAGSSASQGQQLLSGPSVCVKQEVRTPPSVSGDELSVLKHVKSEGTDQSNVSVKEEGEKDGSKEGEQVSAVGGAKSKALVKRVTWNIQEPEGPQPEKSASKLALYKLKLRQEGVRRPSSMTLTSSQDTTGAVGESAQKGAVTQTLSRCDGRPLEGAPVTGQGETEEGVVLRKDLYLKKLHMQERAVEEVKLAIKPFYQRRDINKDEYKEILRKAVQKVCHSKSGEINPVKVGILVKAYVDKYKHARKHRKGEDSGKAADVCPSSLGP